MQSIAASPGADAHQHGSLAFCRVNTLSIWILDLDTLEFVAVNDAAVKQFGYPRSQYLSMTLKDIVPSPGIHSILRNLNIVPKVITEVGIQAREAGDEYLARVEVVSHKLVYNERSAIIVLGSLVVEPEPPYASQQMKCRHSRQSFGNGHDEDITSRIYRRLQVLGNNREIDWMVGMSWTELQDNQESDIEIAKFKTFKKQGESCEALLNIKRQLPEEHLIALFHDGNNQADAQHSIWSGLVRLLFYHGKRDCRKG